MAANRTIVDLRNLLAERFVQPPTSPANQIVTGIAVLDQATGGGLGKRSITEIISAQPNAGSALLIHNLLRVAQRQRFFMALVDGRDSFDVQSASPGALPYLFWVRCERATAAIKAADFLLRDGNFPLVLLDLILNSPDELRHIQATTWYRLQRLVESAPTAFLVMSRHNMVASARSKIALENQWTFSDLSREQMISQLRLRLECRQSNLSALG